MHMHIGVSERRVEQKVVAMQAFIVAIIGQNIRSRNAKV